MENINISNPNDGLGDKVRNAFLKVNNNFTELNNNMVLKISGKQLSENDLTDALVVKLLNTKQIIQLDMLNSITYTSTLNSEGLYQDGKTVMLNNGDTEKTLVIDTPVNTLYYKTGAGKINVISAPLRNEIKGNTVEAVGLPMGSFKVLSVGSDDYIEFSNNYDLESW